MSRTNKLIPFLISLFLITNSFIFYEGLQNPYEFPKFLFAVIIAQILAICLLVKMQKLKFELLTKLVFSFLLINFFADILGLDPKISLIGSFWRHQGFLLLVSGFILYLAAKVVKEVNFLEKSIVISGVILSMVTIFEFIALKTGASLPTYNGRLVATLGNPDFLGAYLVMSLPFILFANFKQRFFKPLWTLSIFSSVLITQSRSALLGFFVVLIIYFVSKLKLKNSGKMFLIVLAIGAFSLAAYQTNLFHRSSIWESRNMIWGKGVEAVLQKPILGYGQENFELVFPKHLNFKVDNAHNLFLETAVSAGLLGISVFFLLLLQAFKKADFKLKLFLIAFVIGGFFNPLFISGIMLFWIVLGIIDNPTLES